MTEDAEANPKMDLEGNQVCKSSSFPYTNDHSAPQQLHREASDQGQHEIKVEEIESKLCELLDDMSTETTELGEFLKKERELTKELYCILRGILVHLKTSFNVPAENVTKLKYANQIKLDTEAQLVVVWSGNKVDSKPLKDYSPDVVLAVLWTIFPELEKVVKARKEKTKKRVGLLERIRRQMTTLQKAFAEPSNEGFKLVPDEGAENTHVSSTQKPIS